MVMSIMFPQCWDGVNLDSPNHKSHMAYGAGWPDKGCPSTHPVPLAQITQNFRYRHQDDLDEHVAALVPPARRVDHARAPDEDAIRHRPPPPRPP